MLFLIELNERNERSMKGIRHPKLLISLLLALLVLVAFWPVRGDKFINLDDNLYVFDNPYVKQGLTPESIAWAFKTFYGGFYIPITWCSFMLDHQMYWLNPAGYHLTNLLFHLLNSILLFLALQKMTGSLWKSAFTAALFAVHPLHVESVAWVTERKDVLSTLFWMLALLSYIHYTRYLRVKNYLLTLLLFVLGLLSKPMVVTLPFVLLLLDYWPLQRFQSAGPPAKKEDPPGPSGRGAFSKKRGMPLVTEKVPFLILSAMSGAATISARLSGGGLVSSENLSFPARIANALVSYVAYLGKMVLPTKLAIVYPLQGMPPLLEALGALALLACLSAFAVKKVRQAPFLVTGWLWYLGTLVPVIGIIHVGNQAMADRFTYVPLIGLFLIIAWGVPEILKRWRYKRIALALASGAVIIFLGIGTRAQVKYWKDTITLFEHALDVTRDNAVVHFNFGATLYNQGRIKEAIAHYREVVRIDPRNANVHYNLGLAYAEMGELQPAVAHYEDALRIDPDYPLAHNNLGIVLDRMGRFEEARVHYLKAIEMDPNSEKAHINLGVNLAAQGKYGQAIRQYRRVLDINPQSPVAHLNLGSALANQGKCPEAIGEYQQALKIEPDLAEARFQLGLLYAFRRDRASALRQYRILQTMKPDLAARLYAKIPR